MGFKPTTIETFFQAETLTPDRSKNPGSREKDASGDGFTASEKAAILRPQQSDWKAPCEYRELRINELSRGPSCVAITGMVVNFHRLSMPNERQHAAKGFFKINVKDSTGILQVPIHPKSLPLIE